MGFSIEVKGLDEIKRKLERMERNAKKLDGEHSVKITDLLTSGFMKRNTKFSNLDEMMISGGFMGKGEVLTQEKFEAIPDSKLDEHVSKETKFSDWESMLNAAVEEYAGKRVFDGV